MVFLKAIFTILKHPHTKGNVWKTFIIILWWKINQIFFKIPALIEIAPDVRIICRPEDSYGSFIVYSLWPEYSELSFIYSILGRSDVYIDVGAHIGDSSLLAGAKIKTGKVIAIEPTPEIYKQLSSNIKINNFESTIFPVQKAISNTVGTAHFALEIASEVNHLHTQSVKGKTIKVQTTTIDALMKEHKLTSVTLLKIDVEGFELEALQGASKALKTKKIDMILFEVNPSVIGICDKVQAIEDLLTSFDYSFFQFSDTKHVTIINSLFTPQHTINFLATTTRMRKSKRFTSWLQ